MKDYFANEQRKFRQLVEKSKTNPLPLDGDQAKIKAYVAKNKQIMQEIGILSKTDRIDDAIDHSWEESNGSVRAYLEHTQNMFRESMGLEDPNGIYKALFQSLDEVEKKLGKSLKTSDPQYTQFEEAIEKKFSALLQANPEDLATQAEIADATEEAVRLKAEIGATQSRAS